MNARDIKEKDMKEREKMTGNGASASEEKITLYVTGMTCATCAKIVERALSKVEGVAFAAVNLATDSAFVVLERPVSREKLEQAVKDEGYDIG